jgi:hypothetical protein
MLRQRLSYLSEAVAIFVTDCLIRHPILQKLSHIFLLRQRLSHLLSYCHTDYLICNPMSQTVSPASYAIDYFTCHLPSEAMIWRLSHSEKLVRLSNCLYVFHLAAECADILCDKIESSRIKIYTSVYSQNSLAFISVVLTFPSILLIHFISIEIPRRTAFT